MTPLLPTPDHYLYNLISMTSPEAKRLWRRAIKEHFECQCVYCGETYTVTQESDGPDGFSNSFKIDCTTADASPAAGDILLFFQAIEAQNLQSLSYGTSGAQAITISYYVKSNKTGNASFVIQQKDNSDKQVSFQYTINSANTWEKKTHTIPGDTSGVINDDNGTGLTLEWWLNSGSSFTGGSHRATWTAEDNTDRNASNLGIGGSTDDYWQITGVQVEVGSKATPFEHRNVGDELARCQRYFLQINSETNYTRYGIGSVKTSTEAEVIIDFPVTMRARPSFTHGTVGNSTFYSANQLFTSTSLNMSNETVKNSSVNVINGGTMTAGRAGTLLANNVSAATDFHLAFSAEL